jgi:hypothetical protein
VLKHGAFFEVDPRILSMVQGRYLGALPELGFMECKVKLHAVHLSRSC